MDVYDGKMVCAKLETQNSEEQPGLLGLVQPSMSTGKCPDGYELCSGKADGVQLKNQVCLKMPAKLKSKQAYLNNFCPITDIKLVPTMGHNLGPDYTVQEFSRGVGIAYSKKTDNLPVTRTTASFMEPCMSFGFTTAPTQKSWINDLHQINELEFQLPRFSGDPKNNVNWLHNCPLVEGQTNLYQDVRYKDINTITGDMFGNKMNLPFTMYLAQEYNGIAYLKRQHRYHDEQKTLNLQNYPLRFYTRPNIEFDRRCEQAGMSRQKLYDNINKRMMELSSSKRTSKIQQRKELVNDAFKGYLIISLISVGLVAAAIFMSQEPQFRHMAKLISLGAALALIALQVPLWGHIDEFFRASADFGAMLKEDNMAILKEYESYNACMVD